MFLNVDFIHKQGETTHHDSTYLFQCLLLTTQQHCQELLDVLRRMDSTERSFPALLWKNCRNTCVRLGFGIAVNISNSGYRLLGVDYINHRH